MLTPNLDKTVDAMETVTMSSNEPKTQIRSSRVDLYSSVFSLVCHSVQLVILMPRAMHESGIYLSLIQIILFAFAGYYANKILTKSAKAHHADSMVDLIDRVFERAKVSFLVIFMIYVTCNIILDQIFLIRNLVDLYVYLTNESSNHNTEVKLMGVYITIFLNILLMPSLFVKTLDRIKFFSIFAILTTTSVVCFIIVTFLFPQIIDLQAYPVSWEQIQYFNIYRTPNVYAFYMISFTVQDISIDMCSELQPNTSYNRKKLLKYSFVIMAIVFSLVSLCGYLTLYGKEGFDDMDNYFLFILVHLDKRIPLVLITNYILTVAFLFDCMLNLIPLTKFIDEYVARKLAQVYDDQEVRKKTLFLKLLAMALSFTLIVLVVWFDIDIETLLNQISNVTLPWVFFMLPIASYFVTYEKKHKLNRNLYGIVASSMVIISFLCYFDTM